MLAGLLLATVTTATPGAGIPETLARQRAAAFSALRYELDFRIPDARTEPIRGREVVRFRLASPHRVVLDFAPARDHVLSVQRGGRPVAFTAARQHLVIGAEHTSAGENELVFEFRAGDDSLNRDAEFLYTLFVPARAHLAFPCFDQPDLK